MKKVADLEESSFTFKVDGYYPRKMTVPTELMVDAGATSHIIKDAKKLKNYDQTFQLENHYMKLAYKTKTNGVALKRGDAEVCLLDGNHVVVTLKKHYSSPPTRTTYFL